MFAKAKYIRKAGVVLAVLLVGGFLAAAHFLQGTVVKDYAVQALTQANKAEANIDSLGISVLGGNVAVAGVQLTDPKNPQQNQLAIGKMEAKASIYDLLLGKLVVDKMELSEVRFNQARQTPGTVAGAGRRGEALRPQHLQGQRRGPRQAGEVRQGRQEAQGAVGEAPQLAAEGQEGRPADGNQPAVAVEKVPEKYLEYLTARLPTAATPRMLAKQLLADKTEIPSKLFGNSRVDVNNLSDAPQATKLPITMQIKSYVTPALLKVDRGLLQGRHAGDLRDVRGLRPEQAAGALAGCGPRVPGRPGLRNVHRHVDPGERGPDDQPEPQGPPGPGDGQGRAGPRRRADDPGHAGAQGAEHLDPGRRLADPAAAGLRHQGLTKEFQQALVAAGKERALQEVNKQVQKQLDGKLGEKLPAGVKDAIKQPSTKGLMDSVGGLLGGKKKQEKHRSRNKPNKKPGGGLADRRPCFPIQHPLYLACFRLARLSCGLSCLAAFLPYAPSLCFWAASSFFNCCCQRLDLLLILLLALGHQLVECRGGLGRLFLHGQCLDPLQLG